LVLTLTVIASCALITGTSDVKDRDLDRDGLLGPVRQVVTKSRASTTVATYDRAGMLQHSVIRTPPAIEHPEVGEQLQKFIYVYGPDGRRLHEITEDGEGQQYISRLYAYDASGKKTAEAVYHMCGTFSALMMYSYDPDGLLREALTFHYRSILRQEFTYDQRRRLISRAAYKNGVLQSTTDYKYVDKGYPISEETTNPARPSLNEKSVSMYEYDAQRNWTKRTTRRLIMPIDEDGKPMFDPTELTERTIIYEKSR
jgi:hypothetical protein